MTDPDDRFTEEPEESRRWGRRLVLPHARDRHRGEVLLALGILSAVVGAPSVFLFLPALAGLPHVRALSCIQRRPNPKKFRRAVTLPPFWGGIT